MNRRPEDQHGRASPRRRGRARARRETVRERRRLPPWDLPEPVVSVFWFMAAALAYWSFGYRVMQGSDLWWHLAGGRWMVEHRTLFVNDPFSYTAAGREWVNDAWLSDVLLYLWTTAFGINSLVYWKWGLIIATWLLLFRLVTRISGDPTASFLATLLGIAVAGPFLDVRPQLYSFLGLVVVLELSIGRHRPSAWLPLVFVVWVNLHAGFLLGLIALPFVLAPSFVQGERKRSLLIAAACILACAINPHGPSVVIRPFRYAFDPGHPSRILVEWQPALSKGALPCPMLPYGIAAFAVAALIAAARQVTGRRDRVVWPALGFGAVTLAMALRSCRFVPFFAMAQSLVVAPVLARTVAPLWRAVPRAAPAILAAGLGLYWLMPFPKLPYAFHFLTSEDDLPVETCNFIEANDLSGKVFAYYNWGGYLHVRTNGRLKVFIATTSKLSTRSQVGCR
jgi:hypothetical protein